MGALLDSPQSKQALRGQRVNRRLLQPSEQRHREQRHAAAGFVLAAAVGFVLGLALFALEVCR